MKRLLAIIMVAVLSGCATVGVEHVEQLKPGTTIVPLSLLGDTLAIRHVGTTVFQNERRDLSVAEWQIDRHAEATATRLIAAGKKFQTKVAQTSEARVAAGKLGQAFWTGGAVLQGGPESVVKLAKEAKADYVLLIGPSQIGDPFFGTNQSFSGYGVSQRAAFGSRRAINFLTMRVVLLDGKSGAEVARTQGYLSAPRPASDWMESKDLALTSSNATATKASVQELIEAVLRKNLSELKLVP
jgi:hypothetical protein